MKCHSGGMRLFVEHRSDNNNGQREMFVITIGMLYSVKLGEAATLASSRANNIVQAARDIGKRR